jgi:hypothetical protein
MHRSEGGPVRPSLSRLDLLTSKQIGWSCHRAFAAAELRHSWGLTVGELPLVAGDYAQLRPVLLRLEDRRLPLAGSVLEAVGVEQYLAPWRPSARPALHGPRG